MVNVQFVDQTFRGTPSSSVKARKNVQEERKNVFYVQAGSVKRLIYKLNFDHRPYPIANKKLCRLMSFKSCVLSRIRVLLILIV